MPFCHRGPTIRGRKKVKEKPVKTLPLLSEGKNGPVNSEGIRRQIRGDHHLRDHVINRIRVGRLKRIQFPPLYVRPF